MTDNHWVEKKRHQGVRSSGHLVRSDSYSKNPEGTLISSSFLVTGC